MEKTIYKMNVDIEKSRPKDPRIPDMPGSMFVKNSCRLIEILVGAGRKPEAEKIQKQALEVHDDPKIREAIEKAEAKQKK